MYATLGEIKVDVLIGNKVYYNHIDWNYRKTLILSQEDYFVKVVERKNYNDFIICSSSGTELDYLSDWWDNNRLNKSYNIDNFFE
jgi:hypothetical protein